MNTQVVIFILLAFVVGLVISWIITRTSKGRKDAPVSDGINESEVAELKNEVQQLRISLASVSDEKNRLEQDQANFSNSLKDRETSIREEYERLLEKVREENARLDSALNLATNGKIDESVKLRLQEAETAMASIKELETQLEKLRIQHAELLAVHGPIQEKLEESDAICNNLKKKIKDLEEEVEEAEEEAEALNKKLKKKNQEFQETQEQLEKTNRESKRLQSELSQKEFELSESINSLKRKTDSIEFVQEILSAKESKTIDNVKDTYRAIDMFESFIKGQFMDCNSYLFDKYSHLKFNGKSGKQGYEDKKTTYCQMFEEWASVKRKSWLDKKKTIAFVGEFSAGKTSIVNRILSQDDPTIPRLPVSTKATTAIPTYIAANDEKEEVGYRFVTPDDRLKNIEPSVFQKVSKEVLDEIKGISSLIKYFVMTYNNPNLKGLSILDTPGFNSNDKEDKDRTIEVINECDALFWVVDVNTGTVNRTSLAIIKKELKKPLVVVINKVDTKSSGEVDKVEALVRKTMEEEGLKVSSFIRFSSKAPLSDILTPIKSIRRDDSRDGFLETVKDNLVKLSFILEEAIRNANKKYSDSVRLSKAVQSQFEDCINELKENCETVRDIPRFIEGKKLFGVELTDDKYQMTTWEAREMKEKLDEIAGPLSDAIDDLYREQQQFTEQEQEAYMNLVDLKSSWQKVDDCIKEFKKTTKNLK